jgi:hypothetical protein
MGMVVGSERPLVSVDKLLNVTIANRALEEFDAQTFTSLGPWAKLSTMQLLVDSFCEMDYLVLATQIFTW